MVRLRNSTLLKLIAQTQGYRIDPLADYAPIELPPAELAPRLIDALAQIGEHLESDEEEIRGRALGVLARVWPIAPEKVLPLLMQNLRDWRVFNCTHWLAAGLDEKIPKTESFIALLIDYLADPNSPASRVAASALAACGPAATAAIPALLEVVAKCPGHPEAALALWRVGHLQEALPGLMAATNRLHGDQLLMAIRAIGEIGPSAAEAVPALLELTARIEKWHEAHRKILRPAIDDTLQMIGSMKMRMPAGELIEIAPPEWPSKELSIRPGDFSQLSLNREVSQSRSREPFCAANVHQARGGIIFFADDRDFRSEIPVLLGAMGVKQDFAKYAVFMAHASDPKNDGYLIQLRIVTSFALYRLFGAITSAESLAFAAQPLAIRDLICGFVAKQRAEWNSLPEYIRVRQYFGGQRDSRGSEELGFGFMVEDAPCGVYRLWTRVWVGR